MKILTGIAHAKLNLTLDVVGRRPDGYHNLCMVMQETTLGDEIVLTIDSSPSWKVLSESGEIPCDTSNLAVKAAELFYQASGISREGLTFQISKHTPVCAGLGGGSADAALILKLLQEYYSNPLSPETLYLAGEKAGSDVPFALFGGTALAEEKGQILTRLPDLPECDLVLCKPPFPISTPALFHQIDNEVIQKRPDTAAMLQALQQGDLRKIAALCYNVFEPIVSGEHSEIAEIETCMHYFGALGACMSGSGPTVFGIFESPEAAAACTSELKLSYPDTCHVHPVSARSL